MEFGGTPSLALTLWTKTKKDRKLEESIATQLRELPEKNSDDEGAFFSSFFFKKELEVMSFYKMPSLLSCL